MLTIRELMVEYILFCYDEDTLMCEQGLTEADVANLSDIDLLELYDQTVLSPIGYIHGEE